MDKVKSKFDESEEKLNVWTTEINMSATKDIFFAIGATIVSVVSGVFALRRVFDSGLKFGASFAINEDVKTIKELTK